MSCDRIFPSQNWGIIPRIFPSFKNCACCKKIWRIIKTIASIWGENMLGYLSLDNCWLLGTDNVCGQISEHIFAPNGDYCLFTGVILSLIRAWFSVTGVQSFTTFSLNNDIIPAVSLRYDPQRKTLASIWRFTSINHAFLIWCSRNASFVFKNNTATV